MNFNVMCVLLLLIKNDILAGVRYNTASTEPFFYDASYNHSRWLGAIPVDLCSGL